jgi:hypothetical protein
MFFEGFLASCYQTVCMETGMPRFWMNWLRAPYIGLVVLLVRQLPVTISEKPGVTKQVAGDSLQSNKMNVQE